MASELENAVRSGTVSTIVDATVRSHLYNQTNVLAEAIVAERESRVPSPKTIDEVAVGLATLTIHTRDARREAASMGIATRLPFPRPYALLIRLIGVPIFDGSSVPDWAESALESHHDDPAALVSALRQMAAMDKGENE